MTHTEFDFDVQNVHLAHRHETIFVKPVDRRLHSGEVRSSWTSRQHNNHSVGKSTFPCWKLHTHSVLAAHFQNVSTLLAEQRKNAILVCREFRICTLSLSLFFSCSLSLSLSLSLLSVFCPSMTYKVETWNWICVKSQLLAYSLHPYHYCMTCQELFWCERV